VKVKGQPVGGYIPQPGDSPIEPGYGSETSEDDVQLQIDAAPKDEEKYPYAIANAKNRGLPLPDPPFDAFHQELMTLDEARDRWYNDDPDGQM
jgi:hypothetical protein